MSATGSDRSRGPAIRATVIAEQLRRPVPGGIGTYTASLLRALRDLPGEPVDTMLLASAPGERPDPLARLGSVRSLPFPSRPLSWLWHHDRLRGPAVGDVVHATSFDFPAPRRRNGIPLSVFVHDLVWRRVPETFPARGVRWHEAALARAIAHASALVVPSTRTADDLLAAGAPAERVHVVPEGSDHLPPARRLGEGGYFLTVSTIEPRKNLGRLVEAYARIRSSLPEPWPLKVVGPAGWRGSAATGLPEAIPEGVELVGSVDDATLADLYSRARVFVYVPLVEGFGLPPVEAMRYGAPVIASAVPSVEDAACIVDPLDVDAIGSAMLRVASDDAERVDLRARGDSLTRSHTWASCAQGHVTVWESIVGGRR